MTVVAAWNIYEKSENLENPYFGLMEKIEILYFDLNEPDELQDGKPHTTTGDYNDKYWSGDIVGDCDGNEDSVADYLNNNLDVVLSPLGLDGVGHYYTTTVWDKFVEKANELVEEFHYQDDNMIGDAWEKLHGKSRLHDE